MYISNNIPVNLVKCSYIVFILIFFKTSLSIHHPLEILLQNNVSINSFLKHPIYNTGVYENKVCFLGHLLAIFLVVWIMLRKHIFPSGYNIINKWIWFTTMFISLIMNPNVFIYLLPVFILDI